ncbi:hypothetical protein BDBG_01010 [Blastomyces gilchristii SLH14081]|uniref:Uncharacterized protein n=1 Tax=Blastomyces gilchristii (strain SLH14081) TaxID=559298 RepID=A0A179UD82_BLAGS|nr:uncharacterized protein BDBG_01010 [Blastomyces gilchristii SLH14081]OAT04462.1 hypothetical protein BDBG_01010 [Blastomyces gilchristii SLH14081]
MVLYRTFNTAWHFRDICIRRMEFDAWKELIDTINSAQQAMCQTIGAYPGGLLVLEKDAT